MKIYTKEALNLQLPKALRLYSPAAPLRDILRPISYRRRASFYATCALKLWRVV
jgi:hypothetical protein